MSSLKFRDKARREDFYSERTKKLIHRNSKITQLPRLPRSLEVLNVSLNKNLRGLPNLPPGLRELYCSHCDLTELPRLPESLVALNCSGAKLTKYPKLPRGLRALRAGHIHINEIQLPPKLQALLCDSVRFGHTTRFPDTLRILDFGANCKFPNTTALVKLPPKLQILSICCPGIVEIRDLPVGLKYLDAGPDVRKLPKLPDGLEVLDIERNQWVKKLPKLPDRLKVLITTGSLVAQLPELPPYLEILVCKLTAIAELPELPDGLKVLIVQETKISGSLVVPSKVEILNFANTQVDKVSWRDGIPPLKEFVGWQSRLRQMPPLPENILIIDVSSCRLTGTWTGYIANAREIICNDNKLTELPDIARAERVFCQNNELQYLPYAAKEAMETQYYGNPSQGAAFGNAAVPSLKELAGGAVYSADLADKVPVVDLREYLDGFRRCPKCGRWAVLRKKFIKFGLRNSSAVGPTCHRCRPENPTIKIPLKNIGELDVLGQYLAAYLEYYNTPANNSEKWFVCE
jgi:Leucine-rich repeat (LRR) protein